MRETPFFTQDLKKKGTVPPPGERGRNRKERREPLYPGGVSSVSDLAKEKRITPREEGGRVKKGQDDDHV